MNRFLYALFLAGVFLYSSSTFSQAPAISRLPLMKIYEGVGRGTQFCRLAPSNHLILAGDFRSHLEINGYSTSTDPSFSSYNFADPRNYIMMLDGTGSVKWTRFFSGTELTDVVVDEDMNVYITGTFGRMLAFNGGDTLKSRTDFGYGAANVFVVKFDSLGNIKWMAASDDGGNSQSPPRVTSLALDNDGNVYMAGVYGYYIRFSNELLFTNDNYYTNYTPSGFLAKLSADGKFLWARDSAPDIFMTVDLTVDSCGLTMCAFTGGITKSVIRKFGFDGEFKSERPLPESILEGNGNEYIKIKDDKVAMFWQEGLADGYYTPMIGMFDMEGNNIWKADLVHFVMKAISITKSGHVLFAGTVPAATDILGRRLYKGSVIGCFDESGDLLWIKNIRSTWLLYDASISEDGRLAYFAVVDGSSGTFGIDHISYTNLSTGSYVAAPIFKLNDSAYHEPQVCPSNSVANPCLDRRGIVNYATPAVTITGAKVVNEGETSTIDATSIIASETATFQWQDSTSSIGWQVIPGTTGTQLNYKPGKTGDRIRCVWASTAPCLVSSSAISDVIIFTVNTKMTPGSDSTTTPPTNIPTAIDSIQLYPNPARNFLVIDQLKLADKWLALTIVNAQGNVVYLSPYIQHQQRFVANLQSLPRGIYTAVITNKAGKSLYKRFALMR